MGRRWWCNGETYIQTKTFFSQNLQIFKICVVIYHHKGRRSVQHSCCCCCSKKLQNLCYPLKCLSAYFENNSNLKKPPLYIIIKKFLSKKKIHLLSVVARWWCTSGETFTNFFLSKSSNLQNRCNLPPRRFSPVHSCSTKNYQNLSSSHSFVHCGGILHKIISLKKKKKNHPPPP